MAMHLARFVLLFAALAILITACWLAGCGSKPENEPSADGDAPNASQAAAENSSMAASPAARPKAVRPPPEDPVVVLHTSAGDIKIKLFAQKAPQTVDNFLSNYADRKFYDETIFHHVEPGSLLIAGGYDANLESKPTRTPIYNESRNGLSNKRGTVAMICDPEAPHSATSQFFINLADNPNFDSKKTEEEVAFGYCVFGQVVEGLEVAEKIAKQPTTSQGDFAQLPTPTVAIRSVERLR
jgi:cyclophilin family peptidyl-prolyl cis-trans isomerase